jgi:subtilisin-like proprotein convertase family protein
MSRRSALAVAALLVAVASPAGAQVFSNPTPLTIPSSGAASLYPSQILVSGVAGTVGELTVTLVGLDHAYPADLDVLLVGPEGQNVTLMSDAGGGIDADDATLVFDDGAEQTTSIGDPITSGRYRPSNQAGSDAYPEPAPAASGLTALSTFAGTNPNGLWSLYVVDDSAGDLGSLDGWSITLPEPGPEATGAALVALLAVRRCRRGARRR